MRKNSFNINFFKNIYVNIYSLFSSTLLKSSALFSIFYLSIKKNFILISHIHRLTFSAFSLFQNNYNFMFLSNRVAEIVILRFLRKNISLNLIMQRRLSCF